MTEKKDNGSDEPEVIIVPPEDQDVIPPEKDNTDDSGFIDAEATPVNDAAPSGKRSRLGLWIVVLVVAAFIGGFVAWPKLAPTLEPWLPDSLKPGTSRLVEVTKALDELAVRIATLKNNSVSKDTVLDLEDAIKAEIAALKKQLSALAARPELPAGLMAQVDTLGVKVDDFSARLEKEVSDLRSQFTALQSPSGDTDRSSQGAPSLAALEDLKARLTAVSETVSGFAARLAELESRPAGTTSVEPSKHEHEDLTAEVASLKSLTSELMARLSTTEARLASVADMSAGGAGAALVAAAGQLRSRIESGQAFAIDLQSVASLAGDDADLKAILQNIGSGEKGLVSLAGLRREFDRIASGLLAASTPPADNWLAKVWQRLASMISIRRTGDVAGDDVAALVARAEVRLQAGDLAAAVQELKSLPDTAATVAAPWMQRAEQRLKTLAGLDDLTRQAVQRLAQPAGISK
jgi:hypothetical protein